MMDKDSNTIYGFIIIILLVYIYFIQFHKWDYQQEHLDSMTNLNKFKTGDIICFKAYNNFNSIVLGNYYGHIGIVYVDTDTQIPMIFEANGIEKIPLLPHHNKNGVFYTELKSRIQKYKGRVFVKTLNKNVNLQLEYEFKNFINFALENMHYDYNVFSSWVNKFLGLSHCGNGTNCGELAFLSIIKLGILDEKKYYSAPKFHHVSDVSKLQLCDNGYFYYKPVEIIDYPFDK